MTPEEKIFRRAAERIASGKSILACWAIVAANRQNYYEALVCFERYFHPGTVVDAYWWEYGDQGAREIALLLMAEMAATGDL